MKPIPAIVEKAVDIDMLERQIAVWIADERQADTSAARWEQQAADARATARSRRLDIGKALLKARGAWPERGPNAKGWGEFLKRLGIDQSTAWRYMHPEQAKSADEEPSDKVSCGPHENPSDRDDRPANVHGGSGEKPRGAYCTPKKYAEAVGSWDLDPFSNPSAHIIAKLTCMLENGGDGFGDPSVPGSFKFGPGLTDIGRAVEDTRVWIQPDYRKVLKAIAHYGHTRFCALLRFAPDTKWFRAMWPRVVAVAIPLERLPFETPEGVTIEGADEGEDAGAPFPHVFYYTDERDITPAIRELCIVLPVDHAKDPQQLARAALHIVR